MSKPNRQLRFFVPATLLATLLAASCILDLSGPDGGIGYFALAPAFPGGSTAVVDVDSVHVVLRRTSDNTVALDTAFSITPSDTIDLTLSVVLKEPSETFWLELECFDSAGNLVFVAGPIEVTASTSSGEVVAQDIEVEYVGVGYDAWDADVPGEDVYYIHMGDTYTLEAVALDSSGIPIPGTPIKWISYDTTRVVFPDPTVGQMLARQLRGWVQVAAELLTGQNDIVDVYVEPVPSEVTIFSGDNQTGEPGTQLPAVLEVQVNAPDGPVEGSIVDFTTADGGTFSQPSMATDADGYAWTTWTLGPGIGQQTAIATVRAYPALQATFTAASEAQPATVSWINFNGGNWSNPANWSTGTVPTAIDTVEIEMAGEYTVVLDVDAMVDALRIGTVNAAPWLLLNGTTLTVNRTLTLGAWGGLQLSTGSITGAGSVDVYGTFHWEEGTVNTEGAFTIRSTGMMLLTSVGSKTLSRLRNEGRVEWSGGDISVPGGVVVENLQGGYFGAYANNSMSAGGFDNSGTFEKDGPDATTLALTFENAGVLNIGAGSLVLNGSLMHYSGALLSGVGTLDLTGGSVNVFEGDIGPGESPGILTINGDLPLGTGSALHFELDGTTAGTGYDRLDLSGVLEVSGNLNVVTGFTPSPGDRFTVLSFGSRTGDFTNITGLDLGGGLALEPQWNANSLELVATSAQPAGTVSWITDFVDSDWHNPANWDLGRVPTALDTARVIVDVNVTVDIASDVTVARLELGGPSNANTQQMDVQQGITLRVDSSATIESSGRLVLNEVNLEGAGDLMVRGIMQTFGSNLVGPGGVVVEAGGILDTGDGMVNNRGNEFNGRLLTNGGLVRWGGDIVLNNGAQFVNNASTDIDGRNHSLEYGGVGAEGAFVNNGTLRRILNTDMTSIMVPLTGNSGSSLQVLSGTVVLAGGSFFNDAAIEVGDAGALAALFFTDSTHTIDAQSMVTLGPDGLVQVADAAVVTIDGSYDYTGAATGITELISGAVAFNGSTAVIPHLYISGGTLSTSSSVLVATSMGWSGGNMAGTGTIRINSGAALSVSGASAMTAEALTIDNRGTTLWAAGNVTGISSPQFVNDASATFEMQSDGLWGGSGTFHNNGMFRYTGTTAGHFGWALVNAGTLDAVGPSGILRLIGDFTHQDDAIIQGSGSIDYAAANVLGWDGDVNPGGSGNAGTLNLMGNALPSALSTANIEIGGLTAGTEHDQVTVTGDFAADGTLDVSILNGFTPQVGQTFTVLTLSGTKTGDFASYTGLDLGGGLVLEPQWNAASLDLVVAQPAPAQILFAGDSAYGLSTGVFTVNPDATGLTHPYSTTSLGDEEIYPRWSPNRERIAFNNRIIGAESILYMMYATGDTLVSVVTDTSTFVPRWSPNGTHLAFECGDGWSEIDVCVVGDVTGALSTLLGSGNGGGKVYVTDFDPTNWSDGPWVFAWDPLDHNRITVVRDSIPPTGGTGQSMIFTMLFDGTNVQRLLPTGVLDAGSGPLRIIGGPDDWSMGGNLDWSPDGQWLVFAAVDPSGQQNIYRINRDGSNLIALTATADSDDGPMWSPNGSEILFGRDLAGGCDMDMWIMNADGSNPHAITAEHVCDYPVGRLGADWSPDGQEIALTGFESPGNNLFIYVILRTTTAATYFTDRAVVGPLRGQGAASFEVIDIQPNWRP